MPAFLSAATRFLLASVLMGLFLRWRRGPGTLRVRASEFGACALVGGLLLLGCNGLVVVAEQHIDSGLAALVVAAVPLWVVLLRLANRDRPRTATIVAVPRRVSRVLPCCCHPAAEGSTRVVGVLTVLCASFLWSIGSYFSAQLPLPKDPFVTTVYEMFAGGALMLVVAVGRGEPWQVLRRIRFRAVVGSAGVPHRLRGRWRRSRRTCGCCAARRSPSSPPTPM